MKILLLAPSNYEFSYRIQKELERQGHEVKFIKDRSFKLDYYLSYGSVVKRGIKYVFGKTTKEKNTYWKELFDKNGELYDYRCDQFLCVNGYSLCTLFFKLLKQANPQVKCIYYLWDSTRLYAFYKYFSCFDKCFTFDYKDAEDFKIDYLPMFWIPIEGNFPTPTKPRVFFIGSIHSDRYKILKKIIFQLDEMGIDYYVKLYVPKTKKPLLTLRAMCNKMFGIDNLINDLYRIQSGKETYSFIVYEPISLNVFNQEMMASSHIIDIEQPCQTAMTPRVVQALAYGKKIVTTNVWLSCSEGITKYIQLLDRSNPIIKQSFFNNANKYNSIEFPAGNLHLSNWLQKIICYE